MTTLDSVPIRTLPIGALAAVCSVAFLLLLSACGSGRDVPLVDEPDPSAVPAESYDEIGDQRVAERASSLIGSMAPAASIEMLDGSQIELAELLGEKPLYLKFWATWCIPCRGQMPHFQSVHEKFASELNVIGVNVGLNDDRDAVRAFEEEYGLSMPIAFDEDGSVSQAFGLVVTPQHVVIDRSGIVRYLSHTAGSELDSALEAAVRGVSEPASETAGTVDPPVPDSDTDPAAPSLALVDGTTFDLESKRGQPIVLSFTATWCDWYLAETRPAMSAACVEQQKNIENAFGRFGSEVHFAVIAQSLWTDSTQVESYRERYAIESPLGFDETGAWFSRFSVRDIPTTIVLDADGIEVVRMSGAAADLGEVLESR